MKRVYNNKISERANRSLEKREAEIRSQRRMFTLIAVVLIVVGVLLGTGIRVFAGTNEESGNHKYYKSICIEEGDTLWDIAGEYMDDTYASRYEYIDEICNMNQICADEIQAGDYIIVAYFSDELK